MMPVNYTTLLQHCMQRAGIISFQALSHRAGVSPWQLQQLRQGHARQLRLDVVLRLSQTLQLSLPEFLLTFGVEAEADRPAEPPERDRQTPAPDDHRHQFQAESLQILEPWLRQWATAVFAAQQNPQLPASRLIPLVQPVETLMQRWGITTIAPIGAEVPFDPHQHQLLTGQAQPGEAVRIRYAGYWQGDRLLYRAQVSPVTG